MNVQCKQNKLSTNNLQLIHTELIFGGIPVFGGALAANEQLNKFKSKVSNQGASGSLSRASSFSGALSSVKHRCAKWFLEQCHHRSHEVRAYGSF